MNVTTLDLHKDPKNFRVGEMDSRAYFIPFGISGGVLPEREESDRLTLLSGEWLFKWVPSLYDMDDCFDAGYEPQGFSAVTVPDIWQCRGVDYAQYESAAYPFLFNPPHVPEKNPAGAYLKRFRIKKRVGRRYELHLEGKDSCAYVFVNGQLVGYSEAPHSTSVYDVTEQLRNGENLIGILVLKWCSGSYLDDQDKIRLSGLFRDVYILERDEGGVRDFCLTADMNGTLSLTVECDLPVLARVYDGVNLIFVGTVGRDGITATIPSPHLWSAEDPHLYDLYLTVGDEVIRHRFGFRTVCVKDGVLLLNGAPIKLYGVNRHDSHPDTGYAMSREDVRAELILMKRSNINAIRTSHYPNAPFFYELCDELGFYVMCEADYESDGCSFVNQSYRVSDAPEYVSAIVDRNVRMGEAYKNFTSVIIWSLGNESTWGEGLRQAAVALRRIDPTRPIHYEQFFLDHAKRSDEEKAEIWNYLDFYSNMYPTIAEHRSIAEMDWVKGSIIMCEYSHAMGNSSGDMRFYDELIQSDDRYAGGFVWEWADHAVRLTDGEGVKYNGYGGDLGEHHHRGNVCMDGAVDPDRVPHSGLYEIAAVFAPVRLAYESNRLTVTNRHFFTSLDKYTFDYSVDVDGRCVKEGGLSICTAPGATESVSLPTLPVYEGECATLTVSVRLAENNAWGERGYRICASSFALPTERKDYTAPDVCPTVVEERAAWRIFGEGFEYLFRKDTAMLTEMTVGGESVLSEPISLVCMRAATDNDNSQISIESNMLAKWRSRFSGDIAYPEAEVVGFTLRREARRVVLSGRLMFGVQGRIPVSFGKIEYIVYGDGRLEIAQKGRINSRLPYFLPRYGYRLTLPQTASDITYYGYGPLECYEDKISHALRGRHPYTPDYPTGAYEKPQESGSHCYTDWLAFSVGGARLRVTSRGCGGGRGFSFSASRYDIPTTMDTRHKKDLVASDNLYLYLDYRMSGVGSASCGGELPLESVRINPGEEFDFTFSLEIR